MGYSGVVMQDPACELPRMPIPRTRVNKGKKKGRHTAPGPTAERTPHQEAQGVRGAAVVQEGLRVPGRHRRTHQHAAQGIRAGALPLPG